MSIYDFFITKNTTAWIFCIKTNVINSADYLSQQFQHESFIINIPAWICYKNIYHKNSRMDLLYKLTADYLSQQFQHECFIKTNVRRNF